MLFFRAVMSRVDWAHLFVYTRYVKVAYVVCPEHVLLCGVIGRVR